MIDTFLKGMILKPQYYLIVILLAGMALVSCKRGKPYDVNISHIRIDPVEIKRYEEVLFTIDPANLREEIDPHIDDFSLFLGEEINTPMGQQQLYDYITDPFIKGLYEDTKLVWDDVAELERELTLAFRYLQYHFAHLQVPVVYSYVSGIDYELPAKYYDGNIIIGLDMFMGVDYVKYEQIGIPKFKRQRFLPENTALEALLSMVNEMLRPYPKLHENLLDHMIFEGKLLYFLDCMFPGKPDSLKIAYTTEQINWAERNQGQSWSYYIENELLYSTDRQMVQKFIGAAPFTAPFSAGSAPRMGIYNGWQIVRAYMRRNSDVGLQELLFEKDAREILSKANYRP